MPSHVVYLARTGEVITHDAYGRPLDGSTATMLAASHDLTGDAASVWKLVRD